MCAGESNGSDFEAECLVINVHVSLQPMEASPQCSTVHTSSDIFTFLFFGLFSFATLFIHSQMALLFLCLGCFSDIFEINMKTEFNYPKPKQIFLQDASCYFVQCKQIIFIPLSNLMSYFLPELQQFVYTIIF